jgi:hypothetical protein
MKGDAGDEEVEARSAKTANVHSDSIQKAGPPLCGTFLSSRKSGAERECRSKKIVIAEEACRTSTGRLTAKGPYRVPCHNHEMSSIYPDRGIPVKYAEPSAARRKA